MDIIVADPSPIANARLCQALRQQPEVTSCVSTFDLTETYNAAEHQEPSCVVIVAVLARTPEFELLSSLFKIMGIGCVILGAQPTGSAQRAETPHGQQIWVDSGATPHSILHAIQLVTSKTLHSTISRGIDSPSAVFDPKKIIAIGASTGGIDALLTTIAHFSEHCPPTLIVQHTGDNFANSLIGLLDRGTAAKVLAAKDNAPLAPGHIYLAPHRKAHLCLSPHRTPRIALQPGDLASGHRPSVDMLFFSAKAHAPHVTAALLTGMGRDGAMGLLALRNAGAHTIGQDAATSVVYGMPRVAMEMGGVTTQLPLPQIGPALLRASLARQRA